MFKFLYVLILGTAFCTPGLAKIPVISDAPTNLVSLGNSYVDAWQTLRIDLDTLNHGNVHPEVVHLWLGEASDFLLTDIINHALNPTVVLFAGQTLAQRKNGNIAFLHTLAQRWQGHPLHAHFSALRVVANDKPYLLELTKQLQSKSTFVRINAAEILALAGKTEGKKVLLRHIQKCGPRVITAAQVLARMGEQNDRESLETAATHGCEPSVLQAASGEILFRQLYPFYYELILRRDPSEARYHCENGMYSAWFQLVRFAYQQNIQSPKALTEYLHHFNLFSMIWPSQEAQVAKRNVDALKNYFHRVTELLQHNSPAAKWPHTFTDAMDSLHDFSSKGFLKRVSAAIALLEFTSQKLQIDQVSNGIPFSILSPRGARVTDGNWRTSWQGIKGDALVVEWPQPTPIKEIRLATGCVQKNGSTITKVQLKIGNKNTAPRSAVPLNPQSRFYQTIPVNEPKVKKLEIVLTDISSSDPACITELRVTSR